MQVGGENVLVDEQKVEGVEQEGLRALFEAEEETEKQVEGKRVVLQEWQGILWEENPLMVEEVTKLLVEETQLTREATN